MDDSYALSGRPRCNAQQATNLHHYRVRLFYMVLDKQLVELNNRFTEGNTELLLCMACLNPSDSFLAFDKEKLIRLAQFYPSDFSPSDFSPSDLIALSNQLDTYIFDMRSDNHFLQLKGVGGLAEKMVQKRKNVIFPLVYKLVKLALILPIATATVERAFSGMKIIKNRLRNRMGDQWINDCLVTFIEKEVFDTIDNETIIQRYQGMTPRQEQL
ncbi:hypothetical protein L1049_027526 [Liquidambar formosana]|uniref:HAT C-terminal dimerisation domain-containing protein n=1 Tax=Liquidambar formosana TaxID=63359 RepID=A0AAP0RHP7_LIQFO